eukprot:CAMPEP_0170120710 /NCGR_PEP_ID=MMETSP0020_2-20130122/15347_1 /TAXON_ID=98059 /ORGANISM="Dinobryon sp., Strain UTEXLB2267" /LENGTH=319 /DNA_ID=CAMNT_0010350711 /DNA_START=8 /DNA_END=964 /DNA_ORIENTATION=-
MVKALRTKIGSVCKAFEENPKRTGKQLSDAQKALLANLVTEKKIRYIANKIGCTVGLWKNRFLTENSLLRRPNLGNNRKISLHESREIVLLVKRNPDITIREIRDQIGRTDVCLSTIARAILGSYWKTKKPFISKVNQKKRVKWCKEHLNWTANDWNKVIWSDESPFLLQFNGRKRVWRRHNERYNQKSVTGSFKNETKVMVWGCFCAAGVGNLTLINGIMDSKVYTKILDNELKPSVRRLFKRKPYIFQQDNDPKHKSKWTTEYLEDHDINVMDWPPQSPDLNPIENLWSILDFQCRSRQPKNAQALFEDLLEAWNNI